jgi:hypothetical protein
LFSVETDWGLSRRDLNHLVELNDEFAILAEVPEEAKDVIDGRAEMKSPDRFPTRGKEKLEGYKRIVK